MVVINKYNVVWTGNLHYHVYNVVWTGNLHYMFTIDLKKYLVIYSFTTMLHHKQNEVHEKTTIAYDSINVT